MKKVLLGIVLILSNILFAAKEDAFGRWVTEKSSSGNRIVVEIYEKNSKIYGRIHRLTDRFDLEGNLKKDTNNPDKEKQNRTLEGIDFVSDFTYSEKDNMYLDGTIYDPSSGKTYACYMQLQGDGTLKVRGHLKGLSFIGKTQIWKRLK
ncbi:DUF2147 domain-containing protein [Caviibacter abscessus]|uniref:DUF2147 domain-containing protein n=1 Tax=Caviibacter abscessus TaxID=1766719 RepID=UPI000831FA81|nr:DUF2147 domain-containing protein [Caviibacter abscessus]